MSIIAMVRKFIREFKFDAIFNFLFDFQEHKVSFFHKKPILIQNKSKSDPFFLLH